MFQVMKTQITNTILIAGFLVMSVSGCAALKLQPVGEIGQSLGIKPDSVEMQFGMARMMERKGKLTEAREAYQKILDTQSHPESLHRLGVIEIRQNRLDVGLKHLSKAVAAGDASAELLGDLGYAQFLSEDLTAAEQTLKKAVALDPSQNRNVNNLAIVVGKQDRLKESLQLFRQAGPEAQALANLAFVQSQSENLVKAKENYSRALDLDPKLKIAAVGLLEVDKHIKTQNDVQEVTESKVVKSQFAESQVAESQVVKPQVVEYEVVEPLIVEPKAIATPTVRRASWNQPATATAVPKSYPSEASDRVLAKIKGLDPVPVQTDREVTKTAQRRTDRVPAVPKELSKQDLLSAIARLIDDAEGSIDIVDLPAN